MITRRRLATLVLTPAALFIIEAACNRVPLLAPSGSTITLTTATTVVPINGRATIIAQVLENAGTAPQAGTHVTFTTSLGTIEPADASTDTSGRALVTFQSTSSGTANITAISGSATTGTNPLKILVGSAAAQKISVAANPATVPAAGGTSTISAIVFDVNGAVLPDVPVTFSTTAGTMSVGVAITNATGTASSVLTTSVGATVTAAVGVGTTTTTPPATTPGTGTTPAASGQASGSVTVSIAGAPTLVITPPAQTPTAGIPSNFTFAVTPAATNGSSVRSLIVDWGDGSPTQNLGAVTGNAIVSHTFGKDGTFVVTGQVTDASGNTVTVSSVVFVAVAPPLAVSLTSSQSVSGTNTIVQFTATVTGLGTQVAQTYHWDFGDATVDDTSNNQNSHSYVTAGLPRTARVTVTTSSGATASASKVIN